MNIKLHAIILSGCAALVYAGFVISELTHPIPIVDFVEDPFGLKMSGWKDRTVMTLSQRMVWSDNGHGFLILGPQYRIIVERVDGTEDETTKMFGHKTGDKP